MTEAQGLRRQSMWSFLGNVLQQGAAIQQDYAAGNFANYEAYAQRMDAAAREREDQIRQEFPEIGEIERLREFIGACQGRSANGYSNVEALRQFSLEVPRG